MLPILAFLSTLVLLPSVVSIAPGLLNIKRDEQLARDNKFLWRSYVVFNEDIQNDWTDGELAGLARQAFLDMNTGIEEAKLEKKVRKKEQPSVMTAIALGSTVSFASSLKNDGFSFLYEGNLVSGRYNRSGKTILSEDATRCIAVARALKACQIFNPIDETYMGHRNIGSCGEQMAAYQICMIHNDPQFTGGKVVSITGRDGREPWIVAPCDMLGANFGCSEFTSDQGLGLYVVPDTTIIVARDPIEGALSCTQPSFCLKQ